MEKKPHYREAEFSWVADFNPKAKSVYEKAGFRETGYLKDFIYRNGKYNDYLILCITKVEFFQNRQ